MAPVTDNPKRTGAAIEAHYRFLAWFVPMIEKLPKSPKNVTTAWTSPSCFSAHGL
jgi:hypothetical protein